MQRDAGFVHSNRVTDECDRFAHHDGTAVQSPSFLPPAIAMPQLVTRMIAYPLPLCVLICPTMLLALGMGGRRGTAFGQLRTARIAVIFATLFLAGVFGLAGCGTISAGNGVSKGSHTLTMTASSGQLAHNATMTVIVQ